MEIDIETAVTNAVNQILNSIDYRKLVIAGNLFHVGLVVLSNGSKQWKCSDSILVPALPRVGDTFTIENKKGDDTTGTVVSVEWNKCRDQFQSATEYYAVVTVEDEV